MIAHDTAIMKSDLAPGAFSDIGGMRNHDNGPTDLLKCLEERQYLVAGNAIEGSGWLVSEYKCWSVHNCTSNCDALLLPSRKLIGPMIHALTQSHSLKRLLGLATSFGPADSSVDER